MADVRLNHIAKAYAGGPRVINDVTIDVRDEEFLVLVGPSGCGKSTLLRMIAGLEDITAGELLIDGQRVNDQPPAARDIAMVFQNYALYPHMTVFDNMAFGLKLRGLPKADIRERVTQAARILEIENLLDRKPKDMSGGQRQRVAIGRAIVRNPKVFLFDEPLSNLDAKLRGQTRLELQKLHRALRATIIYVTHDQVEAMTLGDRIVVLRRGDVMQHDTPLNLYNHPANLFVAGFIGTPPMNFLRGSIRPGPAGLVFASQRGGVRIDLAGTAHANALRSWSSQPGNVVETNHPVGPNVVTTEPAPNVVAGIGEGITNVVAVPVAPPNNGPTGNVVRAERSDGNRVAAEWSGSNVVSQTDVVAPGDGDVVAGIRAEHLTDSPPAAGPHYVVHVVADVVEHMGSETLLYTTLDGERFVARLSADTRVAFGQTIPLYWHIDKTHFFDARTEQRIGG